MLEIGYSRPLYIRIEELRHSKEPVDTKLFFISDIHLRKGRSSRIIESVLSAAEQARCAVTLIGGDFVDDRAGLEALPELIKALGDKSLVAAVPGNHEFALDLFAVRSAIERAGGIWLGAEALRITSNCSVYGAMPDSVCSAEYNVLCVHDPQCFPAAQLCGFDLVLAGHVHGGQCVLFRWKDRLYPGAYAYPWNVERTTMEGTTLLVSKGVIDLVPIRWNCRREVIVCQIL